MPLRDVGVAAGQKNHAAVQYHFGDRDAVVGAILETRGAQSESRRAQIVADLIIGGRVPRVSDVVDAFVRPLAIHLEASNHYLAFLSLLITENGGYEGLVGVHTGASVLSLETLLARLVPDIPPTILDERWTTAMTTSVQALARYQAAQIKRELSAERVEVLIDDLVVFLSAGITAPVADSDPRRDSVPASPTLTADVP